MWSYVVFRVESRGRFVGWKWTFILHLFKIKAFKLLTASKAVAGSVHFELFIGKRVSYEKAELLHQRWCIWALHRGQISSLSTLQQALQRAADVSAPTVTSDAAKQSTGKHHTDLENRGRETCWESFGRENKKLKVNYGRTMEEKSDCKLEQTGKLRTERIKEKEENQTKTRPRQSRALIV